MASQAELSMLDELDLEPSGLIPADDPLKDFPPEPRNFGDTPTFGRLTLLFEALQSERKHERRREVLQKWFSVGRIPYWVWQKAKRLYPRNGDSWLDPISTQCL